MKLVEFEYQLKETVSTPFTKSAERDGNRGKPAYKLAKAAGRLIGVSVKFRTNIGPFVFNKGDPPRNLVPDFKLDPTTFLNKGLPWFLVQAVAN